MNSEKNPHIIDLDPWEVAASVNKYWTSFDTILERSFRLAIGMKRADPDASPWLEHGIYLFDQLVQRCMTLLLLVPQLDKTRAPAGFHFDYASIQTVARSVWYQFSMFYYFSGEEVSDDERAYRRARIEVIDAFRRIGVQRATTMPIEYWGGTPELYAERQAALKEFPQFKALSPKDQASALRGETEPFHPLEMAGAMNIDPSIAKIYWNLFSGATHSSPLQFFDMARRWGSEPKETLSVQFLTIEQALKICHNALAVSTELYVKHAPESEKLLYREPIDFSWRRLRPKFVNLSSSARGHS